MTCLGNLWIEAPFAKIREDLCVCVCDVGGYSVVPDLLFEISGKKCQVGSWVMVWNSAKVSQIAGLAPSVIECVWVRPRVCLSVSFL